MSKSFVSLRKRFDFFRKYKRDFSITIEIMRDFSILKQRILQFLEIKGITKYKFYQETGITNGILSQKNGLTEENIEKFLLTYPEISAEWLMRGEGDMYVTGKSPKEDGSDANSLERRLAEIEKKQEIRDKEMESIMKTLEKISSELTSINEERDKKHHSLCG